MNDSVLGFLITWTVYGTFLQGDKRWWNKRKKGSMPPEPNLQQWRKEHLKFLVAMLPDADQLLVELAIQQHSKYRGWQLWACSARTNHVHSVITANGVKGQKVRDQLKASCTRKLREESLFWLDRPVWSVGGDCEWLQTEEELQRAIEYVLFAQDRKHLDL